MEIEKAELKDSRENEINTLAKDSSLTNTISQNSILVDSAAAKLDFEELGSADFLPAVKSHGIATQSRPSLSFWQDVWRRFKRNKQALTSLVVIGLLITFVFAGPLIWTVDPTHQDPIQNSVSPSINSSAIVIGDRSAWPGVIASNVPAVPTENIETLPAPTELRSVDEVSTQGVRLAWEAVPGAAGYAIFRNEVPPEAGTLGVPLGETSAGNLVSFEDTASLEKKKYYYSVVAKNLNGTESANASTLGLDVKPGITVDLAREVKSDAQVGELIQLKPAPLGTDSLGRDLLARLMYGGRISIFIGLFAAFLETFIGMIVGGISGFASRRADNYIMRFTDFVLALPFLLFVILLKIAMGIGPGESGITALIIALVALSWPGSARLVRGQVLQLRESEFVQAARMMGAKRSYLLLRHLFPNLLGVLLVSLTFNIPSAIFAEAFLSFIGLGVAAPAASWGSLCNDSIQNILTHPHQFFAPAIVISLTVLAFNLLGDGLRDALDPKMRSNE